MKLTKITKEVLKPIRGFRIFVVCIFLISNFVALLRPFFLGKLLDHLNSPLHSIIKLSLLILFLLLLDFILDWAQNYLWFKMIYKGIYLLRSKIFNEVIKNNFSFFSKSNSGDIINRMINDSAQFAEKTLIMIPMLLMNLSTIIIVFTFIFRINLVISLVILILSLLYFLSYRYINCKLREYSLAERKSYSELLHTATSLYEGIPTIKLFQKEKFFSTKYMNVVENQCSKSIKLQKWKSLSQSLSSLIINIMPVVSVILGVYFISIGKCTIGSIFSIYSYTSFLGEPIRNLTDFNIIVQQSKAIEDRLETIINSQNNEELLVTNAISTLNSLTLHNINFSYGDAKIFGNLNIQLNKGDRLGVTGASGSGKTTLIKILSGQIQPTSGDILINSLQSTTLLHSTYQNRIAILSQDIFLYEDTIINNISFGRDLDSNELNSLIHEFEINNFLDRNINDLSGGERKRVALARVLAGDFDLLILDEPTSDVDEIMENKIISFIDNYLLEKNNMLIVITHRPAILKICNKFLDLDELN